MMIDKLELAAKCEAQAGKELADLLDSLEHMNDDARKFPMEACGSAEFGRIGGLYALATELRASGTQPMTLTVDDRELIERALAWTVHDDADTVITQLTTRLQSLLSDRDKLERERDHWKAECKALCELVSRYTRAALTQTEVP